MSRIIKNSQYNNFESLSNQLDIKQKNTINSQQAKQLTKQQQQEIADDIIANAKEQAKRIVEQAQSYSIYHMKSISDKMEKQYKMESENSYNQAKQQGMADGQEIGYKAGYEKGFIQGTEQSKVENQKLVAFLKSIIEGIDEGKQQLIKKYQDELHMLAFTIAKMIVKKEIKINPQEMKGIIENAALLCKNQGALRISVSPATYNLLMGLDDELQKKLEGISNDIKLIPDSVLSDTDCYIESPIGFIDASVDTQLNNIELALMHDVKKEI